MTKIYLIRSAEAEGDLYGIAHGNYDSDLTNKGKRQVKALKKRFHGTCINAVYTSDLYRAKATAAAVCDDKDIKPIHLKELGEICLGEWEGENWGNIAYYNSEQLKKFREDPCSWNVEGAESIVQAVDRLIGALHKIAVENHGGSVVVFSHGFIIRGLLAILRDIPLDRISEISFENNTGVSVIEVEGETLQLIEYDDISHLLDEDKPYVKPDFDTDMYFHPLPWLEYSHIMADAVECVWKESGADEEFDKNILLNDAVVRQTIIGFVDYQPVGFLQYGLEPGKITLLCTHPGYRKMGLGVQLIGRAVIDARAMGVDKLSIALSKNNPYRQFFLDYGFDSLGKDAKDREIFEKNIGFKP